MTTVDWPGRMQRLAKGKLTELAPHGAEIWLDGGHNPGAGVVVAEAMAEQEERFQRPLFLICGMINTKDQTGYFRAFEGMARHVYTVPVASSDAGAAQCRARGAGRRGGAVGRAGELGRQRLDAVARYLEPGGDGAADPDRRLALSRRRGARRERHAADLNEKPGARPGFR